MLKDKQYTYCAVMSNYKLALVYCKQNSSQWQLRITNFSGMNDTIFDLPGFKSIRLINYNIKKFEGYTLHCLWCMHS